MIAFLLNWCSVIAESGEVGEDVLWIHHLIFILTTEIVVLNLILPISSTLSYNLLRLKLFHKLRRLYFFCVHHFIMVDVVVYIHRMQIRLTVIIIFNLLHVLFFLVENIILGRLW